MCFNVFVPDRDYDHYHVGNRVGIVLGYFFRSFWDNCGIVLGSLRDHLGIISE